jgi:hypothetical protein
LAKEERIAREWLRSQETFAAHSYTPWAQARVAHCRALMAARTELAYGIFLRRARRRIDARTHLRTALDVFEGLKSTGGRRGRASSCVRRVRGAASRSLDHRAANSSGGPDRPVRDAAAVEPRDRRSALSQPAHDRLPPPKRVRQARHHPAHEPGPLLPRLGNRSSNQALSPVRANEPAPSLSSSDRRGGDPDK